MSTEFGKGFGIARAKAFGYDMNGSMQKSLIGLLTVGLVATVAGQGSLNSGTALAHVVFQNSGITFRTSDDRLVYFGEVGGEKLVGTNYAASLYYARPGATELRLIPDSIRLFRDPTTSRPGSWNTAPTAIVLFPDVYYFEIITLTLQVRVWDIQRFESWEGAVAGGGLHGESKEFLYSPPGPTLPPVSFWYMHELRAFAVIPEPSVIAFSLIAAVGLWFVRRFK